MNPETEINEKEKYMYGSSQAQPANHLYAQSQILPPDKLLACHRHRNKTKT